MAGLRAFLCFLLILIDTKLNGINDWHSTIFRILDVKVRNVKSKGTQKTYSLRNKIEDQEKKMKKNKIIKLRFRNCFI